MCFWLTHLPSYWPCLVNPTSDLFLFAKVPSSDTRSMLGKAEEGPHRHGASVSSQGLGIAPCETDENLSHGPKKNRVPSLLSRTKGHSTDPENGLLEGHVEAPSRQGTVPTKRHVHVS